MNARRLLTFVLLAAALATALVRLARSSGSGAPGGDAASRSAPSGEVGASRDLAADEARGGHTLERHVGRSDGELRRRLEDERGISAASSFSDRATAERVVGVTLRRESGRIERWLTQGRGNLALDYRAAPGEVIGRSLERGEREPRPAGAARVVLRRDGDGYIVLTAYPLVFDRRP